MSFSAHYRRARAPQQAYLKFAIKIGLTFFLIFAIYSVFMNIRVKTQSYQWSYLHEDESNPSFKFTQYRKALNKSMTAFWTSIQPGFACPSRHLSRVGKGGSEQDDKGKWVCGLAKLGKLNRNEDTIWRNVPAPCVVYSFVMEGDSYFDADILKKTNCSVYHYDPMRWIIGKPLDMSTSSRLHFQKLTIGGEDKEDKRTLELLMELNGHRWVDILKIDLNSGEYRALERILSDFRGAPWPIGQLIIKFHVTDWASPSRSRWLIALFEFLEYRGLRLFKNEVNPYSPCCAEFSFINVNALDEFLDKEDIEVVRYKQLEKSQS